MKCKNVLIPLFILLIFTTCQKPSLDKKIKIRGWNILTDHTPTALRTLSAAKKYNINHLQLSHEICHDLKDVKHQWNRNIVNDLTAKAHEMGINEVVVWDHALYELDYYPDRFKQNDKGLIDLDNPEFWVWLKEDYRNMLDKVPEVDGIVLTFIETGARVENQLSVKLTTPEEKLAALVDSVASVIINERGLKMYIRSFMYNRNELNNLLKCFNLINNKKIVVMAKETPHDFFVTHPTSGWIENIPFNVIIEFDCTHEFNGQGIVASIFPETHLNRWNYYNKLPNVVGFSIRTDRYQTTSIINRPSEINLFALHKTLENQDITIDEILKDFIAEKYNQATVPILKPVFEMATEIILSSFYTLGLNTTNHSKLDFDYRSIYTRHVSGRWLENPEIEIGHGINKKLHYWKDIVNHLAPAKHKEPSARNLDELPEVFLNNWLQPEELMDSAFLQLVLTEKEHGINTAILAMDAIKKAKVYCTDSKNYNTLYHTFNRTLISAQLRKAYAQIYYANRIWQRGEPFQTTYIKENIEQGISEITSLSGIIKNYRRKGPKGQYIWENDADIALELVQEIKKTKVVARN